MFPAPLDLSTGRKSQPAGRIFRKVLPLDLTITRQADSGTAAEARNDGSPKELRDRSATESFAKDARKDNERSENPCESSAANGLDSQGVKMKVLEVELDGSSTAEDIDDGLPTERRERFAAETLEDTLEVQLHGSSAEGSWEAALPEQFNESSTADEWDAELAHGLRGDYEAEVFDVDFQECYDQTGRGDGLHDALNGGTALGRLHDRLAESYESPASEQDGLSTVRCDSYSIDPAQIEVAQYKKTSSPRRPFAMLPVHSNRSSGHTSHSKSGNPRSPSLKGVTKNKRQKYSQETLSFAIQQIRNGTMTLYKAAKEYSIPKNTLKYRLGENYKNQGRRGPETVLTSDEEAKIVVWIKEMQRKAFPVTMEAVRRKIAVFLKENPRKNPFRDDTPGRRWLEGFLRRHKDVSIRTPEAISKASANVSESNLRNWHATVGQYVHDNDLEDALEDPSRILSGDETGMPMNVMAKKVLAETGSQNVSMVEPSNAKQNTTVLFTFSADGHAYPPLVILPQQRITKEVAQNYPGDWGLGGTETGWIDTAHFIGHIKKVLHPSLVRRNVKFPVLYFVDGHKSHLSLAVVEACLKLNIILISLYPNATRILQPADVGVFGPLKHYWREAVEKFKIEYGEDAKITAVTFPAVLQRAMQQAFKIETIRGSFKPCGIYPFNADAIDYRKCFGKSRNDFAHPEDRNLSSSTEVLASHNLDSSGRTSLDGISLDNSNYASFGSSINATLGQSSSSRSYGEMALFDDVSWHNSSEESAGSDLQTSTSQSIFPTQALSSSGRAPSLECDISKYLTTPKTPERARKHINFKLKLNPVLTATERLEEIRKIEEEKNNLLKRKIELAEKRVQQKAENEEEKKKRLEERKRKLEESKVAREEKQRKIEDRKKKIEEKRAELEEEKRKKREEREKKAEERKRKQEEIAEKKREREAKKNKSIEQPSDGDVVSAEESED